MFIATIRCGKKEEKRSFKTLKEMNEWYWVNGYDYVKNDGYGNYTIVKLRSYK